MRCCPWFNEEGRVDVPPLLVGWVVDVSCLVQHHVLMFLLPASSHNERRLKSTTLFSCGARFSACKRSKNKCCVLSMSECFPNKRVFALKIFTKKSSIMLREKGQIHSGMLLVVFAVNETQKRRTSPISGPRLTRNLPNRISIFFI